jgi:ATP-binding cassette subfamily C protein
VATAGTALALLESPASNFNRVGTTGKLQQLVSSPTGLSISVSGLSFSYNRGSPEILRIDALEIQSGSFTALTGKSGSGKTTFIELLLGLLEPTKGTILIHGQKLVETNIWGSGQISYLSQKPHILNATIRENIAFGAALTLADDKQIFSVLEKVDLAEKVRSLPLGLDSILEGSQLNLSGGEQQRLALARALLAGPRLLLIDEGTNALDIDTESHILQYLIALKGECTIIMSAHQQSTLQHVDQVLEFKNSSVSLLRT